MSLKPSSPESERGAAALLVASCLVLLLGMAAFAIDYGFGLNERRADVAAADIGVMAGAVESLGTTADIRDQILSFTRFNLATVYTNAEWQTLWQGCQDTELAGLNTSGYNFIPVAAPTGWTVQSPWCISTDPAGFVRVRLPDQIVETYFGRVLGVQELATNADAIARLAPRGGGGILPFALLATAADGTHVCLRDGSGQAQEPCDGPDAGNFGALEAPLYGNQALGTTQNCNGAPKTEVLAINIALGIDHRVVPDADGSAANEHLDQCSVINAGQTPDTLNTFQGLSGGTQEGLATGGSPLPGGLVPRLQQGSNPKRNVYGSPLDDVPLWAYIDPSLVGVGAGGTIPNSCVRSTFANGSNPDFDWDGDGTLDRPGSFQHMSRCLVDHAAANGPVLFLETLKESPRFSYVPQFWESDFPNGNSEWRHIRRFKATWLQATWWKKGGTVTMFNPGEAGTFGAGGNWSLVQLSGLLIPDAALPADLRGTPGPSGGLDPYIPELFR